jgi:hypothetical protein
MLVYNVNDFDVLRKQNGRVWDSLMKERMDFVFYTETPAYIAKKRQTDSLQAIQQEIFRKKDSILNKKIEVNPAFALNRLGWVNCDRLGGYDERYIATVQVNLMLTEGCDIKVISKREKRVLSASRYNNGVSEFRTLVNEDLVLVAMKVENDVSYLAIMNMRGENTTLTPNFKALTATEIKEKLKVLDN